MPNEEHLEADCGDSRSRATEGGRLDDLGTKRAKATTGNRGKARCQGKEYAREAALHTHVGLHNCKHEWDGTSLCCNARSMSSRGDFDSSVVPFSTATSAAPCTSTVEGCQKVLPTSAGKAGNSSKSRDASVELPHRIDDALPGAALFEPPLTEAKNALGNVALPAAD